MRKEVTQKNKLRNNKSTATCLLLSSVLALCLFTFYLSSSLSNNSHRFKYFSLSPASSDASNQLPLDLARTTSPDPIRQSLLAHPLHLPSFRNLSIEEVLFRMHQRQECQGLPIFITMAKIASPIYAQLVENFQFTMIRYDLLGCSLLICLNDPSCVTFCGDSSFPCFDYFEFGEVPLCLSLSLSVSLSLLTRPLADPLHF
jgi:hypothetical protein